MATAAIAKSSEPLTEDQIAREYASALIYRALIRADQALKATEVARTVGRADVDTKLARVILSTNPHMTAVDRKWTVWTRYLDTRSTTDQNIRCILNTYGQPMRMEELARELSTVYHRPADVFTEMIEHFVADGRLYFLIGSELVAPRSWLLDIEAEIDDEVLFDNFLADEQVFPLIEAADKAGLDSRKPTSISALLDSVGQPIAGKGLQFLAWRRDKDGFDAEQFYRSLVLNSGASALPDGSWIGPELAERLASHFPVIAQQEVSDNAEAEAQEAAQPLTIGDSEKQQLIQAVLEGDESQHAAQLLEDIFDVTPDFRTYDEDLQAVVNALGSDERVLWVGADRFRAQGTIPGYVFTVPGLLDIHTLSFMDAEGNQLDQVIQDEGFDGGLDKDMLNPLAQDVLDEEPIPLPDPNPPSNARAVIKYHHKQIGTMPLCQFSSGFYPPEPTILETEFVLPGGQKTRVWVNNNTRLLYGLLDWFQAIPIDSGATFTIERQTPDRFVITYNDESEPTMFISRNRVNELLALQERADTEDLSTYDIMREIMEHYRKGIEFLTLHTEVNIVRRTTRRLVASILSGYHCFFQRGGAWVYDVKKLPQGFDKSKRKYLVK